MTIVGSAEVLIRANTSAFKRELEAQTTPALRAVGKEAEVQGAIAGENLRKGVGKESGKLGSDLEKHGRQAGSGLSSGLAGGIGKASLLIAGVGIAGAAAGVKLAEGMQAADVAIAAASGTSVAAATKIGDAFLSTAGKTEFSAQALATAYAAVAGELKATEGHALSSADAMKVMTAADDLATAKQIDLGTATKATAGIMQAFHLAASDAAHVTDVLFSASTQTGQSIDTLSAAIEKVRGKLGDTAGPVGDLAGLLVDMTHQGITGRAAMMGLSGGMTSLLKPSKSATDEQKKLGLQVFDSKGRFVGLGSVIDQLSPKFQKMTQQQQLQAAISLFGAGAGKQMLAVINAGPAAYDKATAAVNRHGATQQAAAKQASSLHSQEKILGAELSDLATRVGAVLIPAITAFVGWLVKATRFVTEHKAALVVLAGVVTGVLATAITVFTVNKMAQFGQSFITAKGHVQDFAAGVKTAVAKVIGYFGEQTVASEAMAAKTEAADAKMAGSNATAGTSFAAEATEAGAASAAVETEVGAEAAAVSTADEAIIAENAAAGTSFAAVITAFGSLAAMLADAGLRISNIWKLQNAPSGSGGKRDMSNISGPTGPSGGGLLGTLKSALGIGAEGAIVSRPTLALIGEAGPEALVPLKSMPGASALSTSFHADLASGMPASPQAKAIIAAAAAKYGISPALLWGLYGTESGYGSNLGPSSAGAIGPFQFEPGTAASMGVNPNNFTSAAYGAARYLSTYKSRGVAGMLSAYNAGPGGGLQPSYVSSVLADAKTFGHPAAHHAAATAAIPAAVTSMLATAQALIGTKYTWGGGHGGWDPVAELKKIGVDCSGFVSQVLHAGGVQLPGPQTTGGLAQNLQAGRGQFVTVWDRSGGDPHQQHALINLAGKWFESGGRASPGGVSQISYAQARQELAGGGFHPFHPDVPAGNARALGLGSTGATAGMTWAAALQQLGGQEATKLLGDIHQKNMGALKQDVGHSHSAALGVLEHDLRATHEGSLERLAGRLAGIHTRAMDALLHLEARQSAQHAKAAQQAADTRLAGALTLGATLTQDRAQQSATSIADATKVWLDQQAQAGLTGAALTAAQAQTSLDQIIQANDAAIGGAQQAVDQASTGSALAQAQAGAVLAQANATSTVQQAQAQSVLDKASFAANAAAQNASTTTSTTTTNAPQFNFTIYGQGMSASQLFGEIGWALQTGALPVSPAPVAAAA